MGAEKPHLPVKLVIPALFSNPSLLEDSLHAMEDLYGPADYRSETIPFRWTNYYAGEMGNTVERCFFTFERLIQPDEIVAVKHSTNRIEEYLAENGKRKVNLDPGYMSLGKFVLATTKNQQHRIWIGDGIYAEITLYYRDGAWRCHEWTYPDYRSEEYLSEMTGIRERYHRKLKEMNALMKKE